VKVTCHYRLALRKVFVNYYMNSTAKVKLFSRLIRHHNFKGMEVVITPYILEEARGIRRL
jgi:hypothetical protein